MLLESTDEASDLSDTSPSDSIQQVTESSSGTQSRSSSVPLLDRLRSPGPSDLERGRFDRTFHLLVSGEVREGEVVLGRNPLRHPSEYVNLRGICW